MVKDTAEMLHSLQYVIVNTLQCFISVKEHVDKREPWDILTQQELAELWVRADLMIDNKRKEAAKDLPPGTTVEEPQDESTLEDPSEFYTL